MFKYTKASENWRKKKLINLLFSVLFLNSNAFPTDNDAGNSSNACALINTLGTVFEFRANVSSLINQEFVQSSPIPLNNLVWTVELTKNNHAESLQVDLKSASNTTMPYWTCEVYAAIKLLHKDGDESKTVTTHLDKTEYSNVKNEYINTNFIDWKDFLENYVKNNEAIFEIELSMYPLNCKKPSDINQLYQRLHIVLDNVSKLKEINSSVMLLRGINWQIRIEQNEDNLTAFLSAEEHDLDMSSSYKVNGFFKLLSFDSDKEASVKMFNHEIRRGSSRVRTLLLDWASNENAPYVENDRINLLVEFKVETPKSLWANEINSLTDLSARIQQARENATIARPVHNLTIQCPVCFEHYGTGSVWTTPCGHLFCGPCLNSQLSEGRCAVCRSGINSQNIHPIYFHQD